LILKFSQNPNNTHQQNHASNYKHSLLQINYQLLILNQIAKKEIEQENYNKKRDFFSPQNPNPALKPTPRGKNPRNQSSTEKIFQRSLNPDLR